MGDVLGMQGSQTSQGVPENPLVRRQRNILESEVEEVVGQIFVDEHVLLRDGVPQRPQIRGVIEPQL